MADATIGMFSNYSARVWNHGMTSARRIGAPDAKNRSGLLDAAEQLMLEEGYAAVTSRRVAEKAALKPQLVHYYFRTMDELFLAAFRRRAEEGLEGHAQVVQAPRSRANSSRSLITAKRSRPRLPTTPSAFAKSNAKRCRRFSIATASTRPS